MRGSAFRDAKGFLEETFVGGLVQLSYQESTFQNVIRVVPDGSARQYEAFIAEEAFRGNDRDDLVMLSESVRKLVATVQDHAIRAYGLTQRMEEIRAEERKRAAEAVAATRATLTGLRDTARKTAMTVGPESRTHERLTAEALAYDRAIEALPRTEKQR